MSTASLKPLGGKSYSSIGHLPGSRTGPADHLINAGQARILTERTRDKRDLVIVQEKLDGSNVSVAKLNGLIVPLVRAGWPAVGSKWEQHRLFASWAMENYSRFDSALKEGERICGEWLAQVHGIHYQLHHEPFVAFDLMRGTERLLHNQLLEAADRGNLVVARVLHLADAPCSIKRADELLGEFGHHGATERAEGAVWRVERDGVVDFLAKYVRADRVAGCYLPDVCGMAAEWNWRPTVSA